MLFGFVLLVCLLTVPVVGGSLSRLADVQLRWVWVAVAGLAAQILVISVLPDGAEWAHTVPHVASYVLVGAMMWANRDVPWMWMIALGGGLNFVAIVANGGVMPALESARLAAGMAEAGREFVNSGVIENPRLLFLGDVFPFRNPWSSNVFSIGDVVISAGAFMCIHTLTGSYFRAWTLSGGRFRESAAL